MSQSIRLLQVLNCMLCLNGENRKEHKLWQDKCKIIIRQAKKYFEEQLANSIKNTNKSF